MFNSLGQPSLISDQNCLAHDALGEMTLLPQKPNVLIHTCYEEGNKMEDN